MAYNVRQYFKRPEGRDYFRQSRATEQTARGTQIKNYYGLNEGNQDITPAMWEYARRNYVKDTGINNNMTEWLNSVDERDIIAFTTWQASPVTMNELGSFIAIVGVHEDSFYLR